PIIKTHNEAHRQRTHVRWTCAFCDSNASRAVDAQGSPRKQMAADSDPVAKLIEALPPLELLRIAPMPESEHLSSASTDTLEREHKDKIINVSRRRKGMRVIHALMIREGKG